MNRYYVSFGLGSILRGYYAIFEAANRDIVVAYVNKHLRGLWSNVYDTAPTKMKALPEEPEQLFYASAEHV